MSERERLSWGQVETNSVYKNCQKYGATVKSGEAKKERNTKPAAEKLSSIQLRDEITTISLSEIFAHCELKTSQQSSIPIDNWELAAVRL